MSSLALPLARAEEKPAAAPAAAADAGAPVAAAASLRYALDEIAAQFEKKTGQKVRITYGATGNLVQQIEKAAPFQVLFAADDKSVKKLASEALTEGTPVIFARGRISIVAPKGSPVAVDGELKGLGDALAAGKVAHFAIANPDVAPYGVAAREALQKAGLWDKLTGKIVLGENVGQAAQFATTGAAEAGIIAHSLALSAEMAPKITAALIPESWHKPIEHGMAVIKGAGAPAKAFADYVRGSEARAILEKNGFSVPGA
jgi:molybdate transport system substrate-binding protein